jgi:hypothetical protein
MNRYHLKNLWYRLTRRRMDTLDGLAYDYEHDGEPCSVTGFVVKQGGYLFIFERSGRESTRIRLSKEAAERVGWLVEQLVP